MTVTLYNPIVLNVIIFEAIVGGLTALNVFTDVPSSDIVTLTHSDKTSGESDADRELLTSIYKILGIIKVLQANSHPHSFGKCRHSKRRHSKRRHSKRRHSRR